jgi:hypothetical protein
MMMIEDLTFNVGFFFLFEKRLLKLVSTLIKAPSFPPFPSN